MQGLLRSLVPVFVIVLSLFDSTDVMADYFKGHVTLSRVVMDSDLSESAKRAVVMEARRLGGSAEKFRLEDLVQLQVGRFQDHHPTQFEEIERYLRRYHLRMGMTGLEVEYYRESGRSRLPDIAANPDDITSGKQDLSQLTQAYTTTRDGLLSAPVKGLSRDLSARLQKIGIQSFRDLLDVNKLAQMPSLNLSDAQRVELNGIIRKLHSTLHLIVAQHEKICSHVLVQTAKIP